MTKISKNIKKLRQAKGLTQEALAQNINVTRQAVSSWENGRTQPDLDMLGTLSSFFSVPVEHLLYGEKFNTKLDENKSVYPKTATVLFSVLGSLLVFAGLILIFVTGWQDLPRAVKLAMSLLPLLGGQVCALLVHFKKNESVSFREGSSILWAAGAIATVALVSSISSTSLGFSLCLLLDIILIFPTFCIMKTVSPLAVYYGLAIGWGATAFDYEGLFYGVFANETLAALVSAGITGILLAAGFICYYSNRKQLDKMQHLASKWFSLAAIIAYIIVFSSILEASFWCAGFACAIALYILDSSGEEQSFATKYLSLPAILVMMLIMSVGAVFDPYASDMVKPVTWIVSAVPVLFIILCAVAARKSFISDKFKIPETVITVIALAAYAVIEYRSSVINVYHDNDRTVRCLIFEFITFALAVVLIIHGAKENSLFRINLGFISICALIGFIVFEGDFELYVKGIVLLVLGAALLFINYKGMARKRKLLAEKERQVTDNE